MYQNPKFIAPAKQAKDNINILIPAAGVSTKIRGQVPKSLLTIDKNILLIEKQIGTLQKVTPNISVVLGYKINEVHKKIYDYKVKVVENPLYKETATAYSIGLGLRTITTPKVLIIYGDILFDEDTLTELLKANRSSILVDDKGNFDKNEIGVNVRGGEITSFNYTWRTKWCQVMLLMDKELDILKHICWEKKNRRLLGFEALSDLLNFGGKLRAVYNQGFIKEIDSIKDI